MRTRRYRCTEWQTPGADEAPVELYHYQTDPDERINLAMLPEQAGRLRGMAAMLKSGWKAALPVI
jgi:hypothetical protein